MRSVTYNAKDTTWSRSSNLMGTTLLPSSDDGITTFSGHLAETELRK
jgi:hypothetical protein